MINENYNFIRLDVMYWFVKAACKTDIAHKQTVNILLYSIYTYMKIYKSTEHLQYSTQTKNIQNKLENTRIDCCTSK